MPRAEAGSTKAIANQMKAKGLQRLRWYCQACQRQMRDENGFKCHVASESHVRNMMVIGEDPRKAINEFSNQFKRDFIQLLRTGHGEKQVNANHFYQEYIGNKEHVHMNATKWASLTEFCKYLGREGVVRVEVDEKNEERGGASGLMIAWIDNSPENLRRQEALRKRERQDKGDESREQRLIEEQIRKARAAAGVTDDAADNEDDEVNHENSSAPTQGVKRVDGEKIKLNFGTKVAEAQKPPSPPLTDNGGSSEQDSATATTAEVDDVKPSAPSDVDSAQTTAPSSAAISVKPISLGSSKPKNVFATAGKKNAFGSAKKPAVITAQKPMSEAERIMKEEIERKRLREERNGSAFKRQKIA